MSSDILSKLEGFLSSAASINSKVEAGYAEIQTVETEITSLFETVLGNVKSVRDSLKAKASETKAPVGLTSEPVAEVEPEHEAAAI